MRSYPLRRRLLPLLSVALAFARLQAQPATKPQSCHGTATVARPVSVVASGGVSKGAYQAGVLWAMLQYERAIRHRAADSAVQIHSFAGASAGNLNTLLGAIEWATPIGVHRTETHSMLWHTWTDVGVNTLLPETLPPRTLPRSMLQPQAFDAAIDAVVAQSTQPLLSCDVVIGNTMTRADAATPFAVRDVRAAQVLRHAMVVHLTTGATGLTVRPLQQSRDLPASGVIITPNTDASGAVPIRTYIESVKASAAFPLAFPPRRLQYVRLDGAPRHTPTTGTFLDGAVFDNEPLSLGLDLLNVEREQPFSCLTTNEESPARSEGCRVAFISPNSRRSADTAVTAADAADDTTRTSPPTEAPYRLLDYATLLLRVIGSAADYELFSLERRLQDRGARCNPGKAASLCFVVTSRYFPIFGEKAVSFGAFLGRPMRELDFYIGAYDGLLRTLDARHCEPVTRDVSDRQRCVRQALGPILTDARALPELSATGREVLITLARQEHGAVSAASVPPSGGSADSRARDLLALLSALQRGSALADTLSAQRRLRDSSAANVTHARLCARTPDLLGPICDDGLLFTLRAYAPISTASARDSLARMGTPDERAFYGDAAFERLRAEPAYEILRLLRRATERVLVTESEQGWELGRIGLRTVDFLLGKSIEDERVGAHRSSSAALRPPRAALAAARLAITPMTLTGGTAGAVSLGWQPVGLYLRRSVWNSGVLANVAPVFTVTSTERTLRPSVGIRLETGTQQLPLVGGATLVLQSDLCLESRCARGPQLGVVTLARRSIGLGIRWLPTSITGTRGRGEAVAQVHDLPALLRLVFGG